MFPKRRAGSFQPGRIRVRQQDYPQAIEYYKKATELAPNYSPAYNLLGYAYRQNVDYAKRRSGFQEIH